MRVITIEEIEARIERIPECGCWIWMGATTSAGYGEISVNRRPVLVHRISWELYHGRPIPEGMFILHRCDTPPCANPHHLLLGTHQDNVQDAVRKGRWRGPMSYGKYAVKIFAKDAENILSDERPIREIAKDFNVDKYTIYRIKNRKTHKDLKDREKAVIRKSFNGSEVKKFSSISSAHHITGINKGNLSSALNGRRKSAGGYLWEFDCTEEL